MFKKKNFILLSLFIASSITGCGQSSSSPKVATQDVALAHFKQLDVNIIPDDHGHVLSLILDQKNIQNEDLRFALSFPELKYLSLNNTSVGDDGLKQITTLNKLEKLYLRHTEVGDDGLTHLKKMNQLIVLDLTGTQVTVGGIMQLRFLSNLDHVQLTGTSITSQEISQLKQSMPECHFVK